MINILCEVYIIISLSLSLSGILYNRERETTGDEIEGARGRSGRQDMRIHNDLTCVIFPRTTMTIERNRMAHPPSASHSTITRNLGGACDDEQNDD